MIQMAVDLWSAMLTLFLIMEPLGNLPVVVAMMDRLMGMILVIIVVQMFLNGLGHYFQSATP
jgi:small neutral amino acid transporter SnatA (MarC family)